jgi:hypothetical protein
MKNTNTRDWLIDSVAVLVLAVSGVYLVPLLSAWFAALSLYLDEPIIWPVIIVPHIIVGSLQGIAAACLIRHRKLFVALLPAILFCVYYVLLYCFLYRWGRSWLDIVIICSWLLLMAASFLSAPFILRRREPDKSLQATAAAPSS